ncbi:MAG TPA: cell division protein ZapA [Calditrichae bacterium]|nr:cell division protein ZapA [Calditrichia bacterium]
MEKKSIKVQIFGNEYSLKSDASEDHVYRVAQYVDDKFRRLSEKTHVNSEIKIAVLAALNIADELFRLKAKYDELKQQIEEESRQLNAKIDALTGQALN